MADEINTKINVGINKSVDADAVEKRNQLFNECQHFMTNDVDRADRENLMTISVNTIPDHVNFHDWIVFIYCLSKIGIMDIYDEKNTAISGIDESDTNSRRVFGISFQCYINKDGRITELRLDQVKKSVAELILNHDDPPMFDLPVCIGYLECLTSLEVRDCRSIPRELSNLSKLKSLTFEKCPLHFPNIVSNDMKLSNLTKLSVSICRIPPSPVFFKWMKGQLPNLETLNFWNCENVTDCILDALSSTPNDVSFKDELKCLYLRSCQLDNYRFKRTMHDVLPIFHNLTSLNVENNDISSIQQTINGIYNDPIYVPSKSLRNLEINYNPIVKMIDNNPNEKEAFLNLLQTFKTICCFSRFNKTNYNSDVTYMQMVNHAGRRIIEGNTQHNDRPLVPSSLWPLLLERAYQKSGEIYNHNYESSEEKNATGLYYLLRHGSALIGRSHLITGSSNFDSGNKVDIDFNINVEQMKKENQSSKYSRDVKSDNNNNKLNNNSSVSSKRKRTYVAPVTTKEDTAEALNCIIDGHPLKRPCTKG